jgi:hypothetical protein
MHDFARNYLAQAHQAIKVFMFDIARKHCETGLRYAKKSPISPIKEPHFTPKRDRIALLRRSGGETSPTCSRKEPYVRSKETYY